MATKEEIDQLKKTRVYAKTTLTGKAKKVKELVANNENIDTVREAMHNVIEAFKSFQNAHEHYHKQMSTDEELEESSYYYNLARDGVAGLEKEVQSYITHSKPTASTAPSAQIKPDDSVSIVGSRFSVASSRSNKSTASAKARAFAKKAALEAKAASLKDIHFLQVKELEIQQKKAEIEIQAEISAAEAEKNAYEKVEAEEASEFQTQLPPPVLFTSTPFEPQTKDNLQDSELSHHHADQITGDLPVLGQTPLSTKTKVELNPEARKWLYEEPNSQPFNQKSSLQEDLMTRLLETQDRQSHALCQLVQHQQQSITALTLPQPNMQVFSGDPGDYCDFVRAFEQLIEGKTLSSSSRLYYLVQYTSGHVQELMRSCLSMQPDRGYEEARRLLKERYGQNYRIAAAHLQRLVDGPPIKAEDGTALQKFATKLRSCANTLSEIGYLHKLDSPDNLRKVVERLPYGLRLRWRDVVDGIIEREERDATIEDITRFVTAKARAASHPVFGKISESTRNLPNIKFRQPRAANFATQAGPESPIKSLEADRPKPKCPLCNSNHWLSRCERFRKSSLHDRLKLVKEKRLCNNCLTFGHFAFTCQKESFCKVDGCTAKHSTFLHPKSQGPSYNVKAESASTSATNSIAEPAPSTNPPPATNGSIHMSSKAPRPSVTGLAIVPVRVKAPGKPKVVETYAFLDNGSNTTFCTEELLRKLGIRGRKTNLTLTTMQNENAPIDCTLVNLEVFDLQQENHINLPTVYSTHKLPVSDADIARKEDLQRWPHLRDIELQKITADVGLLIGSDVPEVLQPQEVRVGVNGGPYATRTPFGWTVNGPLGRHHGNSARTANFVRADEKLSQQFEKFCNLEFNDSDPDGQAAMSRNDKKALDVMERTATLNDSHYEIALPWKSSPPCLQNNKAMAEHRLNLLKKRLSRDDTTFERYKQFIEDLVSKGHARQVPVTDIESTTPVWYLPHHPVFHPQKPDKIRVVFDCSAKWRGTSLNDQLLQGPDLTNSLVGVLTRFREEPVALMSDIEAMFHQVRVRPSDCDCLRFLWWPGGDFNSPPSEYQMLVHLFGATSSPSCANFALRKTAKDNQLDFDPVTAETVLSNFYVDDCLKSVPTTEKAISLTSQLTELLARGGFRLTKWLSNSKEVLESIPESERAKAVKNLDFDSSLTERALGVQWNVQADAFKFKILIKDKPTTRRGILSIVSSVYDPLGFVCPVILPAKAILQELCRKKLKWDDPIPGNELREWQTWLKELPKLEQFTVNRCFKPQDFAAIKLCELHHFSDASERGYGAVSYLRLVSENGNVHCAFVMAKSRLAPLKHVTIPRLELTAAVLATRLDKMIRSEITLPINNSTFWTDSTCVLRYLANKDKRFQVFVANRVTKILNQSEEAQWRYVDTATNPADEASRGLAVDSFTSNHRWTNGPDFLRQGPGAWPKQPADFGTIEENDPEVKREAAVFAAETEPDPVTEMIERHSSWNFLKKVTSWLLRYMTKLRQAAIKRKRREPLEFSTDKADPITLNELNDAETTLLKHVQGRCFKEELSSLSTNQHRNMRANSTVQKSSSIYKLDPTLDDGLIRVGGRLHQAPIDRNTRHPAILPKKSHIVQLITRHYHHLSGHSGLEHTLSLIREKFWIINARPTVKKILNECFSCKRRQAPVAQQKMASLPKDRITPSKPPFTYVGVDCFGPFEVRRGRTRAKRYGVLFTCLTLRAVHIEVTSSLDTESFINALRRFIARRGQPAEMRSDNGGNFVKGEREIREAIKEWNQAQIHNYLLQRNIKWTFNPPAGSHHGGVWERCIRTVRKVMKALMREQTLTDEGLSTLMCEVESIINGRPITKLSDDPRDPEPLTPNHLLLLHAGPAFPPGTFTKHDNYSQRRWRQVQYLADVFWRRWIREYLPSLQERQKWSKERRNFQTNDIVLVLDENTPRSSWPLGRILEVYANRRDGLVRSVKLKTRSTTLVRPVDKIVLLEAADASTSDE